MNYLESQKIATNYFKDKSEKNFNAYYKCFYDVVRNSSMRVLKDEENTMENVNTIFMRMHQNTSYVFDASKSHIGYLNLISKHSAMQMRNKATSSKLVLESTLCPYVDDDDSGLLDVIEFNSVLDVLDEEEDNVDYVEINKDNLHEAIKHISKMEDKNLFVDSIVSEIFKDVYNDIEDETQKNRAIKDLESLAALFAQHGIDLPRHRQSYEDIAKKYGLNTVSALKTRVCRYKKSIKNKIENNGLTKEYHDNGNLKSLYTIIDGLKQGKHFEYYKTGEIRYECEYCNGKLHGGYIEYYKNKIIKSTGCYELGEKIGNWVDFDKTGAIDTKYDFYVGSAYFEVFENGEVVERGIL